MNHCNKMHFIDKREANIFINKVKKAKSGGVRGKLFPYKCTRCAFWHTTRQTKKQQRLNGKRAGM